MNSNLNILLIQTEMMIKYLEKSIESLENLLKIFENKSIIKLIIDDCFRILSYLRLKKYELEQLIKNETLKEEINTSELTDINNKFVLIFDGLEESFKIIYKFYEGILNNENFNKCCKDFVLKEKSEIFSYVNYIMDEIIYLERYSLYFFTNIKKEKTDFDSFLKKFDLFISQIIVCFEERIESAKREYLNKAKITIVPDSKSDLNFYIKNK